MHFQHKHNKSMDVRAKQRLSYQRFSLNFSGLGGGFAPRHLNRWAASPNAASFSKIMVNSISCPVCENLCSSQAASCPKCGHPINTNNQNARVENNASQDSPQTASTGSVLRTVLWIFFAISLFFALTAFRVWSDMPLPVYGYNDSELLADKISIAFRIVPLIIMIIVLAIVYSAKDRK